MTTSSNVSPNSAVISTISEIYDSGTGPELLERDLSLHNDVLFSLLIVCQLVINVAGEPSVQRGDAFQNYTQAIRNLARDQHLPYV